MRWRIVKSEGKKMYSLMRKLYPICRSITGNGVRKTLEIISHHIPLRIYEVPSGTQAFDWVVPKEWNIKDAYILSPDGKKFADFKKSNLHVLNYSVPIRKKMPLKELMKHIYTIEEHPKWIPYRTSYYQDNWGFCIAYNELKKMRNGIYEVVIDSELKDGHLTYGELYLKGQIKDEILISTYICHPSLCNDNLSGIVLATALASQLAKMKTRYSYRFIFIPETIGSIVWLSRNRHRIKNIKHILVVACVGGSGRLTYQKSRQGTYEVDFAAEKALADSGLPYRIVNFSPHGSDERQFCYPGLNLPAGSLMKTKWWDYEEYHTSADNLNFVKACHLEQSFSVYLDLIYILENNSVYTNVKMCEPQLKKYGIYRFISGTKLKNHQSALFWVLAYSDGSHSLLDISLISGMRFSLIKEAADILFERGLLKKCINKK